MIPTWSRLPGVTGGDAGEDQFTAETLSGTYGDVVVIATGGFLPFEGVLENHVVPLA